MWLTIGGLLNLRDLGGTPTADGRAVRPGRLWRSENQTGLAASDLRALVDAGLTDVIDLRTDYEVDGSPSPLEGYDGVRYHHHSFFREAEDDDADILDRALPWVGYQPEALTGNATADSYLAFLADRPDSVLGALRAIADAPGAALVHCAVGKDRTGFTVALALSLVGVPEEEIVADYARTTERIEDVVRRLWADNTYAGEADRAVTLDAIAAHPETMSAVLGHVRTRYGGVRTVLGELGWTDDDSDRLRRHLLGE